MGVGAVNPNAARVPQHNPANQLQQQVQEQLDNLIRTGYFAKKKAHHHHIKIPPKAVATPQVAANQMLQALMPSLVKDLKKVKDKTTEQIMEDTEKIEEVMDKYEETLDEILKLKDEHGKNTKHEMTKPELMEAFFDSVEEQYDDLVSHGAEDEVLSLFVTIFYERISKPPYNTDPNRVLAFCFRLPASREPSNFRAELMFNYILDLTLKFPEKLNTDFLKPLKALTDLFTNRSRGIPNLFRNLQTIQDPHRNTLLETWQTMVTTFPYTVAFPKVFGEEGCAALASWCMDLYLGKDIPDPIELQRVEILTKGLGTPFKNALARFTKPS